MLDQSEALNKLFDVKAFSWTLAMEDLETVLPGGVQVSTLEPTVDKKDGHITVRMRVVGPRDKAVELVQNLEHSRRFLLPRITGETLESTGSGTQQIEPVSATNRVNFDLCRTTIRQRPRSERQANREGAGGGSALRQRQRPESQREPRGPSRRRQPANGFPTLASARPMQPNRTPGGPR